MDERKHERIYLFLVRLHGEDRIVPAQVPRHILSLHGKDSTGPGFTENS